MEVIAQIIIHNSKTNSSIHPQVQDNPDRVSPIKLPATIIPGSLSRDIVHKSFSLEAESDIVVFDHRARYRPASIEGSSAAGKKEARVSEWVREREAVRVNFPLIKIL